MIKRVNDNIEKWRLNNTAAGDLAEPGVQAGNKCGARGLVRGARSVGGKVL